MIIPVRITYGSPAEDFNPIQVLGDNDIKMSPESMQVEVVFYDTTTRQERTHRFHALRKMDQDLWRQFGEVVYRDGLSVDAMLDLRALRREIDRILEVPNMLRDKDALRAELSELTPKEIGVVLAMTLSRIYDAGDAPLPVFLRALADEVERG